MKSAELWWRSLLLPNNNTVAVATIPDIQAIQQNAFESGWLQGMKDAREINALGETCLEQAINSAQPPKPKEDKP